MDKHIHDDCGDHQRDSNLQKTEKVALRTGEEVLRGFWISGGGRRGLL
jgi:hypothetical protein